MPGTGKTSSIKAIANKYGLPIFNVDLESIKTNAQLTTLMNDIIYEVPDKPYILAIEDIDRHDMFKRSWAYEGRKHKVTMQCLLNVIDGVVESHGRILFITCNDKSRIEKVRALIRPGRIDRIVEIGHVDGYQATKLICNYFSVDCKIDDDNVNEEVTPAELIKKMQTTQSLKASLHFICKDESKVEVKALENCQLGMQGDELDLEEMECDDELLEKPGDEDDISSPKQLNRRKRTAVQIKKQVIKKKEDQIKYFERQNKQNTRKIERIELNLKYDRERLEELEEQQRIKKEKEVDRKRKRKEREKEKRVRERESQKRKKLKAPRKTSTSVKSERNTMNPLVDPHEFVLRSGRVIKSSDVYQ